MLFSEKLKALVSDAKEYIENNAPSENITYYKDLNADEGPAEWITNYLSLIFTTEGKIMSYQRKDLKEASEEEILSKGKQVDLDKYIEDYTLNTDDIIIIADMIAKSRSNEE